MKQHIPVIIILRGCAAIAVIFFHIHIFAPKEQFDFVNDRFYEFYYSLTDMGYLGVPIFFVLSGYCILQTRLHTNSWKSYLYNRLLRIFPGYWGSLILSGLFIYLFKFLSGHDVLIHFPSGSKLLSHLVLYLYPLSSTQGMSIAYWTLTIEISFYFFILSTYLLSKERVPIFLGLMGVYFFFCKIYDWPFLSILASFYWLFSFGMGLYYFLSDQRFFSLQVLGGSSLSIFYARTDYLLIAIITCALIIILRKRSLYSPFLHWVGTISYSIYLVHFLIIALVFSTTLKIYFSNPFFLDAVIVTITLTVAALNYHLFEKSGIRISKKLRFKTENRE